MSLGGTGLLSEDEAGTNPDTGSTEHESGGERLAVVDTTGSEDLHRLAGEGRLVALDELDDGRDKDRGRDITSVSTTLTALGADDVGTDLEALLDVLGVANHVGVGNAIGVELVDNPLRGNTDGGDEELSTLGNGDVDELAELALGVVVVGSASTLADLGEEKVNTERGLLVVEVRLELRNLCIIRWLALVIRVFGLMRGKMLLQLHHNDGSGVSEHHARIWGISPAPSTWPGCSRHRQ